MSIILTKKTNELTINERAKMCLYARWLVSNYSTSQLNGANGFWWLNQLKHFEEVVLPNYILNGSFDNEVKFIIEYDGDGTIKHCEACGVEINPERSICRECQRERDYDLPF